MDSPNSGSRRSIIRQPNKVTQNPTDIYRSLSSGSSMIYLVVASPIDRVTTGVTNPATVRDMSVTPYCAAVKKYVYSGTSRNVINFVDTVFNVNKPIFTSRFLYLPKKTLVISSSILDQSRTFGNGKSWRFRGSVLLQYT